MSKVVVSLLGVGCLFLVVMLAACGGGDSKDPTPAPTSATTPATTPAALPAMTATAAEATALEDLHGDDINSATPITLGESVDGTVSYDGDEDFFAFQAEEGTVYRIDVALGTLPTSALEIYTPDGQMMGRGVWEEGASWIVWKAPITGNHFAKVLAGYGQTDSVGTYSLTVNQTEIIDDHGDDIESATPIMFGETVVGSVDYFVSDPLWGVFDGEEDYFVFQAEEGEVYRIELALGTLEGSWLKLDYDYGWIENLADVSNHGDSPTSEIVWEVTDPGEYYVIVTDSCTPFVCIGSYTLTVTSLASTTTQAQSSTAAPTPTPTPSATPTPSPSPTPTPTMTATPTVAASASLLDEYLARLDCASFEDAEDPETNGDLSDFYSGIIDRMATLSPPAEIVEWHELILSASVEAKAIADSLPRDDALDLTELLAIIELFESANVREEEIVSGLPDDVRQQMVDAGCVDEVEVETQPEPTPTPAPPAGTPTPVAAEDDHGNDIDNATAVTVGETTGGVIDYEFDADYFSFTAEEGVLYQIDVALGTLGDSTLNLVDTGNWSLAYNDDFGDSYASRVIWTPTDSGKFYAVVAGYGTGSYTLTIAESDLVDDHGGGTNTATAVSLGADIGGAVDYDGDADYFRFTTEAGVIYQIDVALGTLGDSYAALRDSDDWELAYSDDFGDSLASRIVWEAPESGDYYVEVGGYDTGSYTLTIAVSDIVDDHNNDFRLATIVSVGDETPGAIDYEGDEDFFRFTAEAGRTYRLDVTLGTLGDSVLDLTDSNSAQLAYNDDFGDSFGSRIVWEAPASGNYYVMVSAWSGAGSYTLTISEQ